MEALRSRLTCPRLSNKSRVEAELEPSTPWNKYTSFCPLLSGQERTSFQKNRLNKVQYIASSTQRLQHGEVSQNPTHFLCPTNQPIPDAFSRDQNEFHLHILCAHLLKSSLPPIWKANLKSQHNSQQFYCNQNAKFVGARFTYSHATLLPCCTPLKLRCIPAFLASS